MDSQSRGVEILHVEDQGRFSSQLNGHQAYLYYTLPSAEVMDIQTVFVPREIRGHEVGRLLAKHAVDYARSRGLRVKPSCPFVRWLIEDQGL